MQLQGHRFWELEDLNALKMYMRVRVCFDTLKMLHSFIRNCTLLDNCKFHVIKDESLVSKMEGKTNFRGAYRLLGNGIVECLGIVDVG